ncbi:MAG: phospholipase [Gemmatimonadota bacterium]
MKERRIHVRRSARWYLLGDAQERPGILWVACHGYGQLGAAFAGGLAPLVRPGVAVAVPEAPLRFYLDPPGAAPPAERRVGASWMTREDREADIADYVRLLDAVLEDARAALGGADPEVRLLGFSQGVATVCRWAALGAVRPAELVLWAGPLPPDLELAVHAERFRAARITLVRGERDRSVGQEALTAAEERLRQAGAAPRRLTFTGGHRLDSATLARLAE